MIDTYFENWSHDMAYFLGLIWADGSVSGNRLSLGFKLEDEQILYELLNCLNSSVKVNKIIPHIRKDGIKSSGFSQITITNKTIVESLYGLGVQENKTFIDDEFPQIPQEFMSDFIRGFFDGDGSLFETSQGYYGISIVGTKSFLQGVNDVICETVPDISEGRIYKHCKSFVYYLDWKKRIDVLRFLLYIYRHGGFCFERKKVKSITIVSEIIGKIQNKGIGLKQGKWRLRDQNKKHVGYYRTKEEAIKVRNKIYNYEEIIYNANMFLWRALLWQEHSSNEGHFRI